MPTEPPATIRTPASILLATDLSARCDRALERAAQLARQWQARLVVLTVVPDTPGEAVIEEVLGARQWPETSPKQQAERRLLRDLGDLCQSIDVVVRVEYGHIGRTVVRVAREEQCGLIITGLARNPALEPLALGTSVTWLERHARLPLLVVHQRARGPYRRMVMATDFSQGASRALDTALAMFGTPMELALVHGVELPRASLRGGDREARLAETREQARAAAQRKLAALRLPLSGQSTVVAEVAEPARLLREYVRDHETDLVVVGTRGRSGLSELLLGSVAGRIVASVETDILLVRGVQAAAAREPRESDAKQ